MPVVALPKGLNAQQTSVCAQVRLQLSQDAVICRNAFNATLAISNGTQNTTLTNLTVTINILDSAGQPANNQFGVEPPRVTGTTDVSGGGTVLPGTTVSATWLLLPARTAAPVQDTQYTVGGQFSYVQNGQTITVPLYPAPIDVKPDPYLQLDYFWAHDVYGQDPFSPDIEPPVPFTLGLMVRNTGNGIADDFRIIASQPSIVDNEKGLLIAFEIIDSQVNADPVSPSLTLDLGDINPGATTVAKWDMISSLQGTFENYSASYSHVDALGNPMLSLIDSVNIHELAHAVRVDVPADDGRPDFLANDIPDETINPQNLPNNLYNSDGTVSPVTSITTATVSGTPASGSWQASLKCDSVGGYVYIVTTDPGGDASVLQRVVRSDGREIRMNDNAWTTHITLHPVDQPSNRQDLVHIFDIDGTGSYTLYYEQLPTVGTTAVGAKQMRDAQRVDVGSEGNLIVTAQFPDCFYAEAANRALAGCASRGFLRSRWAARCT